MTDKRLGREKAAADAIRRYLEKYPRGAFEANVRLVLKD